LIWQRMRTGAANGGIRRTLAEPEELQ